MNGINTRRFAQAKVVYDCSVSPPTYGDFLLVVMLARYLVKHGIETTFCIITSEFRSDWNSLDEETKRRLIDEQKDIADILLKESSAARLARVEEVGWSDIGSVLQKKTDTACLIPFEERIWSRAPIYNSCFNVLNYLMAEENESFRKQFLLSFDELSTRVKFDRPRIPYITWHCRYTNSWDGNRNINEQEFVQIFDRLKSVFPQHAIMVVSDQAGCVHFKGLAHKNQKGCFFSKDFSSSLLGDAALILGSDFYFQLRGGGIGVFVYFSSLPCNYFTPMAHEKEWRKGKATSWATEKQIIKKISVRDKRTYLPTGLSL